MKTHKVQVPWESYRNIVGLPGFGGWIDDVHPVEPGDKIVFHFRAASTATGEGSVEVRVESAETSRRTEGLIFVRWSHIEPTGVSEGGA